ncbi:hypothetical protein [Streptomyces sp. NBC_01353]|uniref:hypothetical protein n=1 Tax=Streptomyces sp. NBC_01353 TaxID=2903835 RepID=UPI002E352719|nr:hypothetical protein [Streptomyces sp. NBC_01353]
MERHVLESLLAGDDEASAAALAALRSGVTYRVFDTTHPAERHAGVFKLRLRRMRLHGVDPLGWNEWCGSSASMAGRCAEG